MVEEPSTIIYPPSESQGGWRYLGEDDEVRSSAGMDPAKLALVFERQHPSERTKAVPLWGRIGCCTKWRETDFMVAL
jgi:hypothetical protein